jgi:hypothetical protein
MKIESSISAVTTQSPTWLLMMHPCFHSKGIVIYCFFYYFQIMRVSYSNYALLQQMYAENSKESTQLE